MTLIPSHRRTSLLLCYLQRKMVLYNTCYYSSHKYSKCHKLSQPFILVCLEYLSNLSSLFFTIIILISLQTHCYMLPIFFSLLLFHFNVPVIIKPNFKPSTQMSKSLECLLYLFYIRQVSFSSLSLGSMFLILSLFFLSYATLY